MLVKTLTSKEKKVVRDDENNFTRNGQILQKLDETRVRIKGNEYDASAGVRKALTSTK